MWLEWLGGVLVVLRISNRKHGKKVGFGLGRMGLG